MSSNFAEESSAPDINTSSSRAAERQQAIQTDYYTITNVEGGPVAVLLVLLDRSRSPVRAELHLYEEVEDEIREFAFRQGRTLLEKGYFSPELVPLQVLESFPLGDVVQVQAQAINQSPNAVAWWPRWQLGAAVAALLLLALVIWGMARGLSSTADPTTSDSVATIQTSNVAGETPSATQTAPLSPSQRADPALSVGKRVRVKPNMKVSLVQEPGPDHPVVGYLENQQEATIISGPVLTQGQSDTIVWWRVRLGDGAEAWAPANTSDVTLLELAE